MSCPPPYAAVYFDCDSTLSAMEGVDELLDFADPTLRAEIAALTDRAMNGTLPLAEVYESRLRALAPRKEQLDVVGARYVDELVPHAREVVQALQWLGKHVGVVSGGLLPPVRHVARALGIDDGHVHAVPLVFDAAGAYVDFDRRSPLWRNGGKVDVLRALPAAHHPLAFVGDGVTDLETAPVAGRFVGFGGVVARDAVRRGAKHFVTVPDLAAVLPHVLSPDELARLGAEPRFAPLLPAAGR